jgi:hypothetical protein
MLEAVDREEPAIMNTNRPSAVRRPGLRLGAAGVGAVLALTVIGGIGASALPGTTTASTQSIGTHPCALAVVAVRHDYRTLPASMRDAIAAADKKSTSSDKVSARKDVLKDAQNGGYGSAVESVAKDAKTLLGFRARWDRLPASLVSAVKAAKSEGRSGLQQVVSQAASGAYGSRVEDAVKAHESALNSCIAKVGTSTGTPTPSSTTAPSNTATS